MPNLSRRSFLAASTLATAAAVARPTWAIEPIQRKGHFAGRLSLAAYGYRDFLSGKKEPKMTLFDVANLAADMGCAALEPTSYYFAETTTEYLTKLKRQCTLLGLDISGGAIGNNFCLPDAEKLKAEKQKTKDWIERYSLLGAKTLRIFAGPLAKDDNEEAARQRCIDSIGECCDHAAKFGVILALENHGGIVARADQLLSIVQAIKHDWFGVNLDTGNFKTEDPYGDVAKLVPYAVTVQVKTEMQVKGQKKQPADLLRLVNLLKENRYRGYVVLEYEAAEDPRTAIPRHAKELAALLEEPRTR